MTQGSPDERPRWHSNDFKDCYNPKCQRKHTYGAAQAGTGNAEGSRIEAGYDQREGY